MDIIAHLLISFILFGYNPLILLGSLGPDPIYIVSYITQVYKLKKSGKEYNMKQLLEKSLEATLTNKNKIFILGERLHSFLIIPSILLIIFILTVNNNILYILAGFYLHLIIDILMHKNHGPRFLYPIVDEYFPRGIVHWEKPEILKVAYLIITLLMIIKISILLF